LLQSLKIQFGKRSKTDLNDKHQHFEKSKLHETQKPMILVS